MMDAVRDIFGDYRYRLACLYAVAVSLIGISTAFSVIPALLGIVMMIAGGVWVIRFFWAYTATEAAWIRMGLDLETGEPRSGSPNRADNADEWDWEADD